MEVIWTKHSLQLIRQIIKIIKHIGKKSPKNAAKVIEEIADAVYKAMPNPGIYGPDKYKANNDGSFRAFEKHHYRIAYRFSKNIILDLSVRHISREPIGY